QEIEPKNKKEAKEEKINRRDCLKRLACITAGAAVSASGFDVLKKLFSNDFNQETEKGEDREILKIKDAFQETIEHDEEKKKQRAGRERI
ncbi:hypothetical protein KAI52_03235, partial [Candidatus Parcubacteria bacterium]|nr:hypothetical protein [Candidatus Parcubacteria bacterium]